jgi:hypothetical protein
MGERKGSRGGICSKGIYEIPLPMQPAFDPLSWGHFACLDAGPWSGALDRSDPYERRDVLPAYAVSAHNKSDGNQETRRRQVKSTLVASDVGCGHMCSLFDCEMASDVLPNRSHDIQVTCNLSSSDGSHSLPGQDGTVNCSSATIKVESRG